MQIRRRRPNPAVTVQSLSYQVQLPDAAPRNILEEIVWHKETEVDQQRQQVPLLELQRQVADAPPPLDFKIALTQGKTCPALIAEVKKASPSKGVIREEFDPVAIARSYEQAGAACISVLTDRQFFQGSYDYLRQVRAAVQVPLLCKDFFIYPYQIYQARLYGADAILLIAAILPDRDLQYFLKIARVLGMAALIEVHTADELERVLRLDGVDLVGINNRNLEDFSVDLATTELLLETYGPQLAEHSILVISESGLYTPAEVQRVHQAGATGVLIGESLMKQPDPGQAIATLFSNPLA